MRRIISWFKSLYHRKVAAVWTTFDEAAGEQILTLFRQGKTEKAFLEYKKYCDRLSDLAYWYLLGAMWEVCPDQFSEIDIRRLFSAKRPNRANYLMKEAEHYGYNTMPKIVTGFCPPSMLPSYTFYPCFEQACEHAKRLGDTELAVFSVPKHGVVAVFNRKRGQEILVANTSIGKKLETRGVPQ